MTFYLLSNDRDIAAKAEISSVEIRQKNIVIVDTIREFERCAKGFKPGDTLLSYSTNIIVAKVYLESIHFRAFNVHAASPAYPGRDPHHFAVYDGAIQYGATFHRMSASVDSGEILDVELFDVDPRRASPQALLRQADEAALCLIRRHLPHLLSGSDFVASTKIAWGERKTTRRDLAELTTLRPGMSEEEMTRRIRAGASSQHDNLRLAIGGALFRLVPERSSIQ